MALQVVLSFKSFDTKFATVQCDIFHFFFFLESLGSCLESKSQIVLVKIDLWKVSFLHCADLHMQEKRTAQEKGTDFLHKWD